MKISAKCVLLVLLAALIGAPAIGAELDEGFLGVPWGAELSQLQDFQKLYSEGNLSYYIKSNTVYRVGDRQIEDVIFGFSAGKFFAAYLRIKSPDVFAELKTYMESRYGFPKTTWSAATEETTHRWEYNDIRIKLKTGDKRGRMKLGFYYYPISSRVNEEAQEAHREKARRVLPVERDKKPDALPLLVF